MEPQNDPIPTAQRVLDYAGPARPVLNSDLLRQVESLPDGVRLTLRPPYRWQLAESHFAGSEGLSSRRRFRLYKIVMIGALLLIGLQVLVASEGGLCLVWMILGPMILLMITFESTVANKLIGAAAVIEASRAVLLYRLDGTSHEWRWDRRNVAMISVFHPSWLSRTADSHIFLELANGQQVHLPIAGDPPTCQAIASMLNVALATGGAQAAAAIAGFRLDMDEDFPF